MPAGALHSPDWVRLVLCPASQQRRSGGRIQRRCRCVSRALSGNRRSPTAQQPEHPGGRGRWSGWRPASEPLGQHRGRSGCFHQPGDLRGKRRAEVWWCYSHQEQPQNLEINIRITIIKLQKLQKYHISHTLSHFLPTWRKTWESVADKEDQDFSAAKFAVSLINPS